MRKKEGGKKKEEEKEDVFIEKEVGTHIPIDDLISSIKFSAK